MAKINVVVQAYEAPGTRNQFQPLLNSQVKTRAAKAFLVPVTQFLCRLQDKPLLNAPGGKLTLTDTDRQVFHRLAGTPSLREALSKAITQLAAATRKKADTE